MLPAPMRCPRGHFLRSDRTLVRAIACSCGRHSTWRCYCGLVTYAPALTDGCVPRDEPPRILSQRLARIYRVDLFPLAVAGQQVSGPGDLTIL